MHLDLDKAKKLNLFPCQVYLNGKEVKYCLEFDDVEGWIIQEKVDDNGEFVIVGNEIETEKLYGNVTWEKVDEH